MATDVLARLSVLIDAQTKQFGVALNGLNTQLNKFGATVNAQATSISNFEKRIAGIQRSLGSLGVAFGAFQIASLIRSSIDSIAQFERQISIVSAISGATGKALEDLKDDALRLGASTRFTAQQIAELQTELGRLGFSTEEILNATEAITKLSIATGEDLAQSAAVVGNVVRAFGLDASEATRVVDVMASSFNKSALALDNFQESIKYVAPIAAAANISLEETTSLLGVLSDAGIKGSQAGTGLRRIITDLAKDGRPLAERLQELADKGLTFGGAMDEVGRFAQAALLVLTNNTQRISEFTGELNTASGTADEMAAIMEDNLAGSIVRLTSAWDGFIQSFSEGTGPIRGFIDDLTAIVNILTDISNFVRGEGGTISKILKFLWDAGPIGATNKAIQEALGLYRDYKSELEETEKATKDLRDEEKKRAIESTVNAALASENVEAYIRALDQNIYKEEIIAEIRRRQNEELKKQSDEIINQVGIIQALEDKAKALGEAIKKATSVPQIRQLQKELEGVRIQLDALLKPSIAPEPVLIPIEFAEPDLSLEEFAEKILAIQPKGLVIPVDIELPEDTEDTGLTEFLDRLSEESKRLSEEISRTLHDGISNAFVALGEEIGNLVTGAGTFGDSLLKAVAGFAKTFGQLLIAIGTARIAFGKIAISGVGAVVAGTALVALASAINNQLSRANTVAASGGGSGGGGSSSGTANFARERAGEQIVFAQGEFKVRGTDLVLVLDQTARKMQRTG